MQSQRGLTAVKSLLLAMGYGDALDGPVHKGEGVEQLEAGVPPEVVLREWRRAQERRAVEIRQLERRAARVIRPKAPRTVRRTRRLASVRRGLGRALARAPGRESGESDLPLAVGGRP
jgi:hypothetical protein